MAHKFDKTAYENKKTVKEALKADTSKKDTVSSLADRVVKIEKIIGIR